MTEYQAHTGDGEVLARAPAGSSEQEARLWFYKEHEPKGAILVLAEFESEAEADKARLDCIEKNGLPAGAFFSAVWRRRQVGELSKDMTLLEQIDSARSALKPKVTRVNT